MHIIVRIVDEENNMRLFTFAGVMVLILCSSFVMALKESQRLCQN